VPEGWQMQSSAIAREGGAEVSSASYAAIGWYPVTVPSTVMAGLIENGEYADVFRGKNLASVDTGRFESPWWYRKTFALPGTAAAGQTAWLDLKGINYSAEVWLNGVQIADAATIVGTYRDFELNVSPYVKYDGGKNVLAIKVFKPAKDDLDITFTDWAPAPPDQNMGVWQDAQVTTSGPVRVRHPYVETDLDVPSLARVRLTVLADLANATATDVAGTLRVSIVDPAGRPVATCAKGVTVPARAGATLARTPEGSGRDTTVVRVTPADCPALDLAHPDVWWPWQLGGQPRYSATVDLVPQGAAAASDRASVRFGVRKTTSRIDHGHRLFSVNGVDILIVGAGYAPDLFQRRSFPHHPRWQEDQLRFLRDLNLNTVRLEGKLEDDAFYDLCDQYGILVMAGWMCCNAWEKWEAWDAPRWDVYKESLRTQLRRARSHPSMLAWLHGSDNPPDSANAERAALDIEAGLEWPNPVVSNAGYSPGPASGPTGFKMPGPYTYVPPIFWYADMQYGGAYGYNTEVGPSPVPPVVETLKEFLPPEHRWPIDDVWLYHYTDWAKDAVGMFNEALDRHFGKPTGLEDFAWKAQAQNYETFRAMYEAFNANKLDATGEIAWMLNSAWPSMYGHLYDYALRAGGAYFGTKLGCEPLHVQYRYDNRAVVVTNATGRAYPALDVTADLYDVDGTSKYHAAAACSVGAGAKTTALTVPAMAGLKTTYILRLTLRDPGGKAVSTNSYWLSTKGDQLDWSRARKSDATTLGFLPLSGYADYRALQDLPPVSLTHSERTADADQGTGDKATEVAVTNQSNAIAVMVRLKLVREGAGGAEVLPVFWEDNYFLLLPHESRTVVGRYRAADLGGATPAVEVQSFNNDRR
jgi:exo-1,4-beta-D-glucosaminidase